VLEPRYLKRNPYLAFSESVEDVAPFGDAGKVWPISPDTTTASFIPELMGTPHAGTFTSACGCLIYRGALFGADLAGNAFVCEPAQNLVQRQVLSPAGATFRAQPAHPGMDFLTSPDTWFRPVFAAEGPEDGLYICDMYRKVIDHPQYLPEAVRVTADFDAGKDMGRIYRIVPQHKTSKELAAARKPMLYRANAQELCAALTSPNAWVRATAFRLLLERKDKSTIPLLKSTAREAHAMAVARVAALRLLDAQGELDLQTLESALGDPYAGVREQAVQLSESPLRNSSELLNRVTRLGEDPDPRVRFQCALALGEAIQTPNMNALAGIAMRDGADRWARTAVLSSIGGGAEDFFKALLASPQKPPEAMAAVMTDLSHIFGQGETPERCLSLFNEMTGDIESSAVNWQPAAVAGMAEGLRNRGFAHGGLSALRSLVSGDSAEARAGRTRLDQLVQQAMRLARDSNVPVIQRLAAIDLIGEADLEGAETFLLGLLTNQESTEIQAAAVRACGQLHEAISGKEMISRERWRAYLPPVREAVLAVLMSEPRYLPILLDAIERGDIQPWSIEPARRSQLMRNKDAEIRQRAAGLFKNEGRGDRQKVYEDYKSVLNLPSNASNGHEVFKKICSQCHTRRGEGVAVGPDLSGVQNQPAEALLVHILIPSYEIVPGYASYDIETKDGRTLSGLIASQTATSITLKRSLGATDSILRSNIAAISSSGLSLMPDELEKTMTRQELVDLIAFLKAR
jgi:putative heme-binding domain-containing protein